MRGRFLRRIAIGFGVFFLFIFVAGWLGAVVFGGGFDRHDRGGFFPLFPLLVIAVIVAFVFLGRTLRRTAGPIGDVMDAAERVAEGDLSARASVGGPSEVRDLAAAFNRMAERLEANEEQRRNLLADVAHELRTPLSVIRGRVEGMLDGVYPRSEEHLSLIAQEAVVMARLLDDLRLVSNADAGALRLHRELLEPHEVVEAAAVAHRADAVGRGVTIGTQIDEGLPQVDADRVRLGEIFANLVTNALRYTPEGGSVTLRATFAGDGVAFEVSDTGAGVPPEEVPHLFDRFTKSAESRGSGLGLAIAKSLVRAHGGDISATSVVGSGTTIRFVLPAAR